MTRQKNVYVADAFDIIHVTLSDKISKTLSNKFIVRDARVLFGTSSIKGNSSVMTDSDELEGQLRDLKRVAKKKDEFQFNSHYGYLKLIVNHDWTWVNKYIQVNNWLRKFKFETVITQMEN